MYLPANFDTYTKRHFVDLLSWRIPSQTPLYNPIIGGTVWVSLFRESLYYNLYYRTLERSSGHLVGPYPTKGENDSYVESGSLKFTDSMSKEQLYRSHGFIASPQDLRWMEEMGRRTNIVVTGTDNYIHHKYYKKS